MKRFILSRELPQMRIRGYEGVVFRHRESSKSVALKFGEEEEKVSEKIKLFELEEEWLWMGI